MHVLQLAPRKLLSTCPDYVLLAFSSGSPPLQYNLMGDTGPSNAGVIGYDYPALESLCCYHDNYTQLSGDPPVSPPDSMSDVVWRDYQYLYYTCPHVVTYVAKRTFS